MADELLVIDTGGTMGSAVAPGGQLFHDANSKTPEAVERIAREDGIAVQIRALSDLDPRWRSSMDSCEIHPRHWSGLADYFSEQREFAGIVVLHGTDTLAFSASALSFALGQIARPVVLTGSQKSVHEPTSDAVANIRLALNVAQACPATLAGEVLVAFGGRLLRGNRSTKISVSNAAGFASPSLAELQANMTESAAATWADSRPSERMRVSTTFEPDVWLLDLWPGLDHVRLRKALDAVCPKGVVFRLFGAGVSPSIADLPALASGLAERGVPALAISAIPGTMIDFRRYENGDALARSDIVNGANMTVEAAVTKMMWVLAAYSDLPERRLRLARNLAGELDELAICDA